MDLCWHLQDPYGAVMLMIGGKRVESWLEIAADAKKETDPAKLIELIQILCEALEQIRVDEVSVRRSSNLPLPKTYTFTCDASGRR